MYKYDLLVYIGRFQPLHLGHESVVRKALTFAKRVLIIIGSADSPRTPKNPFTFMERLEMIEVTFKDVMDRVKVSFSYDYPYDEKKWADEILQSITVDGRGKGVIGFIGFKKDVSSYYLDNFNDFDFVEAPPFTVSGRILNGADVRDHMFVH